MIAVRDDINRSPVFTGRSGRELPGYDTRLAASSHPVGQVREYRRLSTQVLLELPAQSVLRPAEDPDDRRTVPLSRAGRAAAREDDVDQDVPVLSFRRLSVPSSPLRIKSNDDDDDDDCQSDYDLILSWVDIVTFSKPIQYRY